MENKDISLVIEFPYNIHAENSLWASFQHALKDASLFNSIRLRIWNEKAVSALSVYEAAYTYCPSSSTIVSSRFNIRFKSEFSSSVHSSLSEKYHYYSTSFINESGK